MRWVSADEAVSVVRSHEQVFVHGGSATPTLLLEALARHARTLEHVVVLHLHTEGPAPHLAPDLVGHIRHRALFIGPNAREAVNSGRADYIPVFLSDVPRLFDRKILPLDAAIVHVAPPDAHGHCSLGVSVDVASAAVRNAKRVIAQVNPRMPRTHGDSFIHVSKIDYAVQAETPLWEHAQPAIGRVERLIGEQVAALVPDGATIQMGIGAIPAAVGEALMDKRDLGIHSEMFTDVVVALVERGVVTGARKAVNRGKIVTSFAGGTQKLYDFLHDNASIEMRPADYTNDTAIIRRFDNMVAINSALEIDLTGQVCADSIGDRLYSGVGGQMDFIRGASLAVNGQAIIAMPSTAANDTISRIAPLLRNGAGVVTTRAHVQTVVTEYGVAQLAGRSLSERARALIAIAHPAFREPLLDAVRKQRNFASLLPSS
ncbi:MAG TPA: acetyl-CoA hydrolase/transferase C-terminal domain-containing protein [Polyangiales bacterium]|nr:acetyl-CoA hydrolase/transferase C-terminal domain-containing protein [Polyangiales bacterium]